MVRILIVAGALVATAASASAQYRGSSSGSGFGAGSNSSSHSVQGHSNSGGSYTQPYQATNPNSTQLDNYSTRGNVNPYTGAVGTRSPKY